MNNLYGPRCHSHTRWNLKDSLSVCRKQTRITSCAEGMKQDNGGGWYKRVWFNGKSGPSCHCRKNQNYVSTINCSKGCKSKRLSSNCGERSFYGDEQYSSNRSAYYGDEEEYNNRRNDHYEGEEGYRSSKSYDNFKYGQEEKHGNVYQTNVPETTYNPTVIAHAPQETAPVSQVAAPVQTITASTPQVTNYAQPVASYSQPASFLTAPTTAYSSKQIHQIDNGFQNYCSVMTLACVVMAFVNPLFGIIAVCFAFCGSENQTTFESRRFMKYSMISSIIGIVSTSLIVITLIALRSTRIILIPE